MYSFKGKKEGKERPRIVSHVKCNSTKPYSFTANQIHWKKKKKKKMPFNMFFIENFRNLKIIKLKHTKSHSGST